ncbi:amidohydrolase family protein [Mariniluteicoccus flavus]
MGFHSHGPGHLHSHAQPHRQIDTRTPAPALHLHGVVLPEAEPVDLWVVDGHVTFTQVAGAETLCRDAWILPGMVDAHCHIGLDADGAVPREQAEEQALDERAAGTLLVRDAGSPSDTRWIDEREDLPRVVRAGRHIARPKRYIRNYADEVEPEGLVESVERQVAAGDGWVKLVGDWIDRGLGDLKPLWPAPVVADAIARAHDLGAKVTAHHFGEEGLDDLLDAGIDGIEHGTGLTDTTIQRMADDQVSLVPTLVNLENFPDIAASGEAKFPAYAAHMRDLYARRRETFGKAYEAGVPIYAGTDAGGALPHGLIGQEVQLLAEIGGAEFALGAASWRARNWLGFAGLDEGAPADLVVFDRDPRSDIAVVRTPVRVVLRGRVVA